MSLNIVYTSKGPKRISSLTEYLPEDIDEYYLVKKEHEIYKHTFYEFGLPDDLDVNVFALYPMNILDRNMTLISITEEDIEKTNIKNKTISEVLRIKI
jgi:hypothetical protein